MKKTYDWLVVGSGLYGAVFTYYAIKAGKSVLVIDRRSKVGGNIRCERFNGVTMHSYGAHIFHTNDRGIWSFVNSFIPLMPIIHSPVAITEDGAAYPLPFNMYTFSAMWKDVSTPEQAKAKIEAQAAEWRKAPARNLEEKALSLVGKDIYETLIKGYTEKQWGRPCSELPPEIIERLPVRFSYNNSYFTDKFVGVPRGGYNPFIDMLLDGADVRLGIDYLPNRDEYSGLADNILFTGCIDEFFDYAFGKLDYRSLRFETKILSKDESQGCSVVNYTGKNVPYTRIIEHNVFSPDEYYEEIVVSREYPAKYENNEPYYPIIDERNKTIYNQYRRLSLTHPKIHFGGRLGLFEYMDMDDAIAKATAFASDVL